MRSRFKFSAYIGSFCLSVLIYKETEAISAAICGGILEFGFGFSQEIVGAGRGGQIGRCDDSNPWNLDRWTWRE
jgi:hypothetical protein